MAKGFTVKANAPKAAKKEEFDIAGGKERMRKTVYFVSGAECSFTFETSFSCALIWYRTE